MSIWVREASNLTMPNEQIVSSISRPYPFINPFHSPMCTIDFHMLLLNFLFRIMHVHLHVESFGLSSGSSINICLYVMLGGVAERCCNAMCRLHSWQPYFHESCITPFRPELPVWMVHGYLPIVFGAIQQCQNLLLTGKMCWALYLFLRRLCCTYLMH